MVSDVTEALTDAIINYLKENQRTRFIVSFLSINLVILAAVLFIVLANIHLEERLSQNLYTLAAIVAIASCFGFLLALAATQKVHKKSETEEELEAHTAGAKNTSKQDRVKGLGYHRYNKIESKPAK